MMGHWGVKNIKLGTLRSLLLLLVKTSLLRTGPVIAGPFFRRM